MRKSNLNNISKDDYKNQFKKSRINTLSETSYLLNSQNNAERLLKSIEDYEKGLGQERQLLK